MFVQLVCLALFHVILADHIPKPSYDVGDYEVVGRHFEKFISKFNKQYDEEEKKSRFHIFHKNLQEINSLNKKHPRTKYEITQFSDYTKAEWKAFMGFNLNVADDYGNCSTMGDPTTKDAPAAWDWRDKGAVSPVKDQRNCGSCWAFSATALLESRNWQNGKQVILSEQQMMDCDKWSSSCSQGGMMAYGLSTIMQQGGQESESDYPYKDADDTCHFDQSKIAATVSSCRTYSLSSEDALKELLYKEGPLSIAVDAGGWSQIGGGVVEGCDCDSLDHGVLLVGYGSDSNGDFWVIKNSWGAGWADKGFIKIKRGENCNCIADKNPASKNSATVA